MACSVASTCYLFTRCKWSSRWSNVLPTSVGVVIGLKDNTQTGRHRQTQADTATHSEQQVSIAILLPHPYAMRCARLNSICCIVGTSLAILLWICLPCCCLQLSQPLRNNNATTSCDHSGKSSRVCWRVLLVFDILRLSTLQSITSYAITLLHFIFQSRLLRCQFRVRKHTSIV